LEGRDSPPQSPYEKKRGHGAGNGGVGLRKQKVGARLSNKAAGPMLWAASQELVLLLPPPAGSLSPSIFFPPEPKGIPNKATVDAWRAKGREKEPGMGKDRSNSQLSGNPKL